MKAYQIYLENYLTTVKYKLPWDEHSNNVEVFKNPSQSEISKILNNSKYKEIRIAYMKDGSILVWDGDAAHKSVFDYNPELKENALDTYYFSKNTFRIHKDRYDEYGKTLTKKQQEQILKTLKEYFPQAEIHPNLIFRYSNKILGKPNETGNI